MGSNTDVLIGSSADVLMDTSSVWSASSGSLSCSGGGSGCAAPSSSSSLVAVTRRMLFELFGRPLDRVFCGCRDSDA